MPEKLVSKSSVEFLLESTNLSKIPTSWNQHFITPKHMERLFSVTSEKPCQLSWPTYRADTPNGLWKSEKTSSRLRVILSRLNLVNFLRMKIIFPSINNTLVNNRSIHGSGWERQHFGGEKPLRKKRVAIYLISFIAVQLKFVGPWWWV